MEFGSLHTLRKDNLLVNEETLAQWLFENLSGLAFLETKNIIHCDIKPENILISLNFHAKITDFGNARPNNGSRARAFLGTYDYCAPEIFFNRQHNPLHLRPLPNGDFNLDTWSLGITYFEVISHKLPWWMPRDENSEAETEQAVISGHNSIFQFGCPEIHSVNFRLSTGLKSFIRRKLMRFDHRGRLNPTQLLNDPYVIWLRTHLLPHVTPRILNANSAPIRTPLRSYTDLRGEVSELTDQLNDSEAGRNQVAASRDLLQTELNQAQTQHLATDVERGRKLNENRQQLTQARADRDLLTSHLEKMTEERENAKAESTQSNAARDLLTSQLDKVAEERETARAESLTANLERDTALHNLENAKSQLLETSNQLAKASELTSAQAVELSRLRSEKIISAQQLQSLAADNEQLDNSLNSIRAERDLLSTLHDQDLEQVLQSYNEIAALRKQLKLKDRQMENEKKRSRWTKLCLQNKSNSLRTCTATLKERELNFSQLEAEFAALQNLNSELENSCDVERKAVSSLQNQLAESVQQQEETLATVQIRNTLLESECSSQRAVVEDVQDQLLEAIQQIAMLQPRLPSVTFEPPIFTAKSLPIARPPVITELCDHDYSVQSNVQKTHRRRTLSGGVAATDINELLYPAEVSVEITAQSVQASDIPPSPNSSMLFEQYDDQYDDNFDGFYDRPINVQDLQERQFNPFSFPDTESESDDDRGSLPHPATQPRFSPVPTSAPTPYEHLEVATSSAEIDLNDGDFDGDEEVRVAEDVMNELLSNTAEEQEKFEQDSVLAAANLLEDYLDNIFDDDELLFPAPQVPHPARNPHLIPNRFSVALQKQHRRSELKDPETKEVRRIAASLLSTLQARVDQATAINEFPSMTVEEIDAAIELAVLKVRASRAAINQILVPARLHGFFLTIHDKSSWNSLSKLHIYVLALLIKTKKGTLSAFNLVPQQLKRGKDSLENFFSKILSQHPFYFTFPLPTH